MNWYNDSERCNGKPVCIRESRPQHHSTEITGAGAVNGFWSDAEWIWCKDGKYRPAKSGVCVLAARTFARILRLCGYGDGLTAPVAAEFIKAYMSTSGTAK